MALQHLRASTADKRPTPAAMADGQLAMNTNLASPGLFFKDSNGDLVKTGPVHVGTTAPNATPGAGGQAGNSKGELWLDTSGSDYSLKTWDGTAFREIVVTSTMIKDGTIVNADVNASAAIAGTKISPDFGSQTVATTGVFSHALGAAATPSVTFTGDLNTGVFSPGADQVAISTNGTNRLHIDSSGNVGIGTTAPNYQLHVTTDFAVGASGFNQQLSFTNDTIQSLLLGTNYTALKLNPLGGNVGIGTSSPGSLLELSGSGNASELRLRSTDTTNAIIRSYVNSLEAGKIAFTSGRELFIETAGTERARIDSSGRLLVGTSTARVSANGVSAGLQVEGTGAEGALSIIRNGGLAYLTLGRSGGASVGSNTAISNNDELGRISWAAADGTDIQSWAAQISAEIDGTPGSNDTPGRLVFSTTADGAASPTERMRINNAGNMLVGRTGTDGAALIQAPASSTVPSYGSATGVSTAITHFEFRNSNGLVGTISTNASATAYNTSSDYRLKENVIAVTDGITRLQQLKPSRFNFIVDPDQTIDGFIAHEAQAIVPECVTGDKDAVDDDGNPVYQGIDQSKLVPLLTAALQEAIAKIETLEARLTAAGIE